MNRFEEERLYGAWDTAVPDIKIIKRTAKMCLVEDTSTESRFRMKIKVKGDDEEMTDSAVPASWRQCYTYSTMFLKAKPDEDNYTEDDYDSWKANLDLERELYPSKPIEL